MNARWAALSGAGIVGLPVLFILLARDVPDQVLRNLPVGAQIVMVLAILALTGGIIASGIAFVVALVAGGDDT